MRVRGRKGDTVSESILVSKREAEQALSLSVRTLDNLIVRKELTARRVGRRVLIPRAELERFARRDHKTQPDGKGNGDGR